MPRAGRPIAAVPYGLLTVVARCLSGHRKSLVATTRLSASVENSNCIGFQRGTHTRWQLVANDGTAAPTLTDMGASFGIATSRVLTLFIVAQPNGSSVW